ncbi:hypothetical protein AKJ57_05065 [candidate division MSBL1 archaeon SCGC-AAA259A05]|uniref:CBS domain-containing protein n=1 Tax=candidate division MSBL1 archaeon SCGC-AAA259A05 TaxID=1698259 RepID=A0A133U634_9EURY|nr:hypothetical protein AKJ57_05065 [candidate division MSBL1 archaeon SCGC-AAA259A05]
MKVKDVMTKDVQAVTVPGSRNEAMELIRELEVSALPVLNENTKKFVGMIRLRDFFEDPDENQLGMLVNRDVVTVGPEQSLEDAARIMLREGVRRLSVVKGSKLEGIITVRDILRRAIAERKKETPVSECMQNSVTTIWERTPLKVALEILHLSGERALPVLDDEAHPVGMIGDEDIIAVSEVKTEEKTELMRGRSETEKWAWDSEDRIYITKRSLTPPDKEVREVMSSDLITITKRTSASKCAELMRENEVHQVPVLSGSKLIGMISDEDLLKALTE